MSEQIVTLETLAGGAAAELFERELQKVIDNIYDPNTDLSVREISIKVRIKPEINRRAAAVGVNVTSKMGKANPINSQFFFGVKDGILVAAENNPDQMDLFDNPDAETIKPVIQLKREA